MICRKLLNKGLTLAVEILWRPVTICATSWDYHTTVAATEIGHQLQTWVAAVHCCWLEDCWCILPHAVWQIGRLSTINDWSQKQGRDTTKSIKGKFDGCKARTKNELEIQCQYPLACKYSELTKEIQIRHTGCIDIVYRNLDISVISSPGNLGAKEGTDQANFFRTIMLPLHVGGGLFQFPSDKQVRNAKAEEPCVYPSRHTTSAVAPNGERLCCCIDLSLYVTL